MKKDPKTNRHKLIYRFNEVVFIVLIIFLVSGCAKQKPATQMSGNLIKLSEDFLIAILPVEFSHPNQKEAAELFRQNLYANFKRARFKLLERFEHKM